MKRGVLAAVVAIAVAGCSGDDEDGTPPPAKGAPKAVAKAIDRLERVTRKRDYATICRELFTRAARARAGGGDCAQLLRSTAADVRGPSIRILSVRLQGDRAQARVRTRARGQAAIDETLELVRAGARYRIEALGE